ncbi:hypothetical protein H6G17_24215 [Chroococcidiopsis sp. FACHB-1243]|uniref:hypothetical protein n=1 Tax=Chroococcidiopsis sp. [FACHB-1243] TaxID=2692781 RepID=UPI0017820016|nr:hypothetical protein [Chroococcidiopsis sp. [FACHB-1243]]MBD2308579.1 hypothetical protein [Chroococcidiopsis sp. [FACHB-1243]]
MVRGNNIRGNGLRGKFNPGKHPRGYRGRFIETLDAPKPARKQLGKARIAQTETGSRKISLGNTTREQKLALLKKFLDAERLAKKQARQEKLQQLLQARVAQSENGNRKLVGNKPALAKLNEVIPKPEQTKGKTLAEAKLALKAAKEAEKKAKAEAREAEKQRKQAEAAKQDVVARKKVADLLKKLNKVEATEEVPSYRLNSKGQPKTPRKDTLRYPVSQTKVEFSDRGVDIWKGQLELGKHTGSWKVHKQPGFDYGVEHQGQQVSINKHQTWVEFERERVRGIPDEKQHYRQLNDEQLLRTMATYAMYVENHVKRSIDAPATSWVASRHGTIPDRLRRNKDGKLIPYGSMDIHHHIQWAKVRFDTITARYKAGDIDLETAKQEMGQLVEKVTVTDKNGKPKEVWQIRIPDQPEDRELVLLPEGGHNVVNRTMYDLLHPMGIHPETGKLATFGVPDAGEWGRDTWFNRWNKRFWAEHYRREVYQIRNEVNRRVKAGELTPEQAEVHWKAGVQSTQNWHDKTKVDNSLVEARKKAIYTDFLGDRKGLKK